jgi:hypothetical protein
LSNDQSGLVGGNVSFVPSAPSHLNLDPSVAQKGVNASDQYNNSSSNNNNNSAQIPTNTHNATTNNTSAQHLQQKPNFASTVWSSEPLICLCILLSFFSLSSTHR